MKLSLPFDTKSDCKANLMDLNSLFLFFFFKKVLQSLLRLSLFQLSFARGQSARTKSQCPELHRLRLLTTCRVCSQFYKISTVNFHVIPQNNLSPSVITPSCLQRQDNLQSHSYLELLKEWLQKQYMADVPQGKNLRSSSCPV